MVVVAAEEVDPMEAPMEKVPRTQAMTGGINEQGLSLSFSRRQTLWASSRISNRIAATFANNQIEK